MFQSRKCKGPNCKASHGNSSAPDMDRNLVVWVMSEWSFQNDSKMMRNREDCDTSLPFVRFSANYRLPKHPKKVAMKQESPSQTILLTSDFVVFFGKLPSVSISSM